MESDGRWGVGLWVEVPRAEFDRAREIWDDPERHAKLQFSSIAANDASADPILADLELPFRCGTHVGLKGSAKRRATLRHKGRPAPPRESLGGRSKRAMNPMPSNDAERPRELLVYIAHNAARCSDCNEELEPDACITLTRENGALCMTCADLDHLVFLRSGDTALTRRAKKHSTLSAVVLRWSRARKRYERQGLLVEEEALAKAEAECLSDADARATARLRDKERRIAEDSAYVERFAARIRELFPSCPAGRETVIAWHACLKSSGRVGRSAAAKALDEDAVHLAVAAHARHHETRYDELLARGLSRGEARAKVAGPVESVLAGWARR